MTGRYRRYRDFYFVPKSGDPTVEGQVRFVGGTALKGFVGSAIDLVGGGSGGASETPAANTIPKTGVSTTELDYNWVKDWLTLHTDCGDGSDGNALIESEVTLTADVQYDVVTMGVGGRIITRGFEFRARKVILSSISSASAFKSFFGSGATAVAGLSDGTAGTTGSINSYSARPVCGGGRRSASTGSGTIANGNVGNSVTHAYCLGGRGGASGAGGNGAGGTGGAAGTTVVVGGYFDPEADVIRVSITNALGGQNNLNSDIIGFGGINGASGGGGAGDGVNVGGGGGCGGHGCFVMRVKIGILEIGAGTPAPIFDSRGYNGGAGGTPTIGNCGGGGGGGGSGGSAAIVILGAVVGSLTDAIDCSGGTGGNGGAGVGSGLAGGGGEGGQGGYIYVRKAVARSLAILDDDVAGGAPSGQTGGTGRQTKASL